MKYSIRYNLRGRIKNTDLRYIGIRVSWAGQRVEMLSGFQVAERYWDNEEQRVRSAYRNTNTTGASINKELTSISSHIDQFFTKCQVEERTPSQIMFLPSLNNTSAQLNLTRLISQSMRL